MTFPDENEERAARVVEAIEEAVDPERPERIRYRRVSYVERKPVDRSKYSNLFGQRKS